MQNVLAELESLLAGFVERDLPGTLVVACRDVEVLYLAQTLARLDERSECDIFLTFTETAGTASALVDAVADSLRLQQVNLAEQLGAIATPPAIPRLAGAPAAGMQTLIDHVLGLLPPGDHRLIWTLLPTELPPDFSAELAEPLLRTNRDPFVRLVLRDDRDHPRAFSIASSWPDEHVLAYSLDFSAGDAAAATAAAARDPQRPAEARIQALMQLAYLDLGHGRLADAEQKFRSCAEFYTATGNAPLHALALAGVADVQRTRGDLTVARQTYEAALPVVAATQAFPVILQLTIALADICREFRDFVDAEGYYRIADAVSHKLLRPHTFADVRESLGVCRAAQGAGADAEQCWTTAAELCRVIDYPKRLHSILGRLADYYADVAPDRARRKACLEEQAALHTRLQEARSC